MKSPINECWIKAIKYGSASFLDRMIIGMKMIIAIKIEWDGPRCWMNGVSRSTSGATERARIIGKLTFVLVKCAVNLAVKYPKAKWPTAYDLIPPFQLLGILT